jgi:hypothetical protein
MKKLHNVHLRNDNTLDNSLQTGEAFIFLAILSLLPQIAQSFRRKTSTERSSEQMEKE